MIDIGEEEIKRPDALLEPALDSPPFLGQDDARDQVEWEDLFDSEWVLVHGEGDALASKRAVRRRLPPCHLVRAQSGEPLRKRQIVRPWFPVRVEHLIPEAARVVGQRCRLL